MTFKASNDLVTPLFFARLVLGFHAEISAVENAVQSNIVQTPTLNEARQSVSSSSSSSSIQPSSSENFFEVNPINSISHMVGNAVKVVSEEPGVAERQSVTSKRRIGSITTESVRGSDLLVRDTHEDMENYEEDAGPGTAESIVTCVLPNICTIRVPHNGDFLLTLLSLHIHHHHHHLLLLLLVRLNAMKRSLDCAGSFPLMVELDAIPDQVRHLISHRSMLRTVCVSTPNFFLKKIRYIYDVCMQRGGQIYRVCAVPLPPDTICLRYNGRCIHLVSPGGLSPLFSTLLTKVDNLIIRCVATSRRP